MRIVSRMGWVVGIIGLLMACGPAQPTSNGYLSPEPPTSIEAEPVWTITPTVELNATQRACPVTLSNGKQPQDGAPDAPSFTHGNAEGTLFTILREDGILVYQEGQAYINHDGSIDEKWPWYRVAPGQVVIRERRLDQPGITAGSAAPLGYGDTGFQPSGLIFPSGGCWEITGRSGEATLTFVMLVVWPK